MNTPANLQRGLAQFAEAQKLQAAGRIAEAATAYNRALAILPTHPAVLAGFAKLAEQAQDWKNAETLWRRLAKSAPGPDIVVSLARTLIPQGRHAEAVDLLLPVAGRAGADPSAMHDLARCLARCGRWDDALTWSETAWSRSREPRFLYLALKSLYELGREEELDARIPDALARFPDNRAIRAVAAQHGLRACKNLARSFAWFPDMRHSDNQQLSVHERGQAGALWDGNPFDGILRIGADAGLGDQILAASLFPELVRTGQRTHVFCDARLVPVFARSFPSIAFFPMGKAGEDASFTDFDADRDRCINAIELGQFYRGTLASWPRESRFLEPDPARSEAIRTDYRARWPGKVLVGISWKSARIMEDGARKEIALADWATMFSGDESAFVSLQYGDLAADLATLGETAGRIHVDPAIDTRDDIDALFAQVDALDLVITTSNVTAHIAGALGKPCWIVLPRTRPVLWYWGYRGTTTPWYPQARLWRNDDERDWTLLMQRLAGALRDFALERRYAGDATA